MHRRLAASVAVCVLTALLACAASSSAATVTRMGRSGHTRQINNPFLTGAALAPVLPAPATVGLFGTLGFSGPDSGAAASGIATHESAAAAVAAHAAPAAAVAGHTAPAAAVAGHTAPAKKHRRKPPVTVTSRLLAIKRAGQITASAYRGYLEDWRGALREEHHLSAWRAGELTDVTVLLHEIAVDGSLTAARLPVLFLTLERNAQYWRSGSWLQYPDRVQFAGSELVWQYYPGYGLQLQVLGTFGEADGFYEAGRKEWPRLAEVIAEMEPLAVRRGGGLTWEYYFNWEGGAPPWVSAMAQGTALEALSDAYAATHQRAYLTEARKLLPLLRTAPPLGVGERTARGWRYLQYSFAPGTYIINAFLQTLIGLYHYAQASGNAAARTLLTMGSREAQHELPSYVVGGWSLYQPGELDDYNYHLLVTGFLQHLCALVKAGVYCRTYHEFEADLTTPPALHQLTRKAAVRSRFALRFKLSQVSEVGAIVAAGGKDFLYTSAQFLSGVRKFTVAGLKKGTYTVTLTATDLAGHRTQIHGRLIACKQHRCPAARSGAGSGSGSKGTTTSPTSTTGGAGI